MRKADNLPPSRAVVMKSGKLNFLEPSGPLQACNGTGFTISVDASLICDKIVTAQNLAFLSYWYRKKRFADALLTGIVVVTQFAKLAAGERLCRRCTLRKLQHFITFKKLP